MCADHLADDPGNGGEEGARPFALEGHYRGAALPRALARQALELGVDVFAGYGMSETGPILTLAQLQPHMNDWDVDRQAEVRCRTGRAVPMVQVRIVDEAMNDVPHDGQSSGEIVARAPWLTQGYYRDGANSEKLWAGGWLHTGDIGVMDRDGWLKITDRLKDVIKTGGEWVSSLDLEDLLLRHPAVAEAAVNGMPNPKWSERPMAVVVLTTGAHATQADLKAHIREFAGRGLISTDVRFLEAHRQCQAPGDRHPDFCLAAHQLVGKEALPGQ